MISSHFYCVLSHLLTDSTFEIRSVPSGGGKMPRRKKRIVSDENILRAYRIQKADKNKRLSDAAVYKALAVQLKISQDAIKNVAKRMLPSVRVFNE